MEVVVAVLGLPSLIVFMVSVNAKQHDKKRFLSVQINHNDDELMLNVLRCQLTY